MADKHQISISTEVEGADTEETSALIRSTIATALAAQGVEVPCEIDVLLSDDAGIHAINLDMRGVDRPTDVLSFPMFDLTPGEKPQEEWADPDSGCVPLGDMVLSLERVEAQAQEYGHSRERELSYLVVHSVLHLLGYDHEGGGLEALRMREKEELVLTRLGLQRDMSFVEEEDVQE